jgi:hypothetical protein
MSSRKIPVITFERKLKYQSLGTQMRGGHFGN